uniref:Uncharacterized protein n=1 Tax=Prymnesium polylepis TaxID=72548 RepID=A0A7S4M1A8_9EUKA
MPRTRAPTKRANWGTRRVQGPSSPRYTLPPDACRTHARRANVGEQREPRRHVADVGRLRPLPPATVHLAGIGGRGGACAARMEYTSAHATVSDVAARTRVSKTMR